MKEKTPQYVVVTDTGYEGHHAYELKNDKELQVWLKDGSGKEGDVVYLIKQKCVITSKLGIKPL